MEKNYFFVSDLHLGLGSPDTEKKKEELFLSFLSMIKDQADELFILGDLFDYWFEYRRVIQKDFIRTLSALYDLTSSGIKVHYIIGNHDFLHRNYFEDHLGVKLYYDALSVELNNKKFYLAHGDGLLPNDTGYKILKKILRNNFAQWLFSLVHPDLGIWIASKTSKTSREYTSNKNYGERDGMFEAAKVKIYDGADYVMFGHSHVRAEEKYRNGIYINLGSWLEKPCYAKFNKKFELIEWE